MRRKITIIVAFLMMLSCLMPLTLGTDVSTDVGNSVPTVTFDSTNTVNMIDPNTAVDGIQFDIGDDNGIDDISSITIQMYRSDGASGDANSERSHWTISWDGSSWSIAPAFSTLTVNDDVNTGSTTDTVNITIDQTPAHTAPSANTGNTTVDGYNWVVDIQVDDGSATGSDASGTTEVNQRLNMVLSTSSISASGSTGDTLQYSPDVDVTNDGNVHIDVNYSATEQTNTNTDDSIPANALYLDDDADHGQTSETSTAEQNYATTTSTWSVDWAYNTTNTAYNNIEVPTNLEQYKYEGTITLSVVQGTVN